MNGVVLPPRSAESASVLAVVALVALLVGRELASAGGPRWRPLARNLTILIGPLLVLFAMIVANRFLVLLASGQPSGSPVSLPTEPAARAEPAAAATVLQAAPTFQPVPRSVSLADRARLVVDWSFAEPRPGWPNDEQGVAWFADGAYHLTAREPGRHVAVDAPLPEPLRDVVVRARFHKVGGPPGGGYGLVLRDQSPTALDGRNQGGRYYVLEVGDLGQVGIWRRAVDHWEDLVPWTPVPGVGRGTQANELVAVGDGDRLALIVNGEEVATATDTISAAGRVGVFVGGDLNHVVLDHLTVEAP